MIVKSETPKAASWTLKASVFATGLAGIVAEYIMSTMASYMLGNTVVQWTLTLSLMLFAMGLGSRVSKYMTKNLLDYFVLTEFLLSLTVAISAITVYFVTIYIDYVGLMIYSFSITIGFLIGLEIPLVTRLNDMFEDLRVNISSVMEKDYYGALLGGLFFAFFALPRLGLTYTPIILGMVNLSVALLLVSRFKKHVHFKKTITVISGILPVLLVALLFLAQPVILFGEQNKYKDHIIYQEQSQYQRIVMTKWKDYIWLYLNGNEQFSSFDEERYHESLVHPALSMHPAPENILVLGGGDGLAVREILKYKSVKKVTLVDLDPAMTRLGKEHPMLTTLNHDALNNPKVTVVNQDAYIYLKKSSDIYSVIFIDLPDPKNVNLSRLYSRQFYALAVKHLGNNGVMVTQAGSPFFAGNAYSCIWKTMNAVENFTAIPYHVNMPTLGEWGFVMGIKGSDHGSRFLKQQLEKLRFRNIPLRFLNPEVMKALLSFGNNENPYARKVRINDESDLVLQRYYMNGNWEIY